MGNQKKCTTLCFVGDGTLLIKKSYEVGPGAVLWQ